jgi:hypothetical protein
VLLEVDFGLGGEAGGLLEELGLGLGGWTGFAGGGGGGGDVFERGFGGAVFFQGATLDYLEFLAGGAEFAGELLDGVFLGGLLRRCGWLG